MDYSTIDLTCSVDADYSQFYLQIDDPSSTEPGGAANLGLYDTELGTSIAYFFGPQSLLLTSARQSGQLPVAVRIHSARPASLDESWRDVVEVSLFASGEVRVTGWEARGDEAALPVETDRWYRVRFAISDMDCAHGEESVFEQYLVEMWPEESTPSTIIAQHTEMGRYCHEARTLDVLRWEIHRRPFEVTERERVTEFARRAFDAFPDLRTRIITNSDAARELASIALLVRSIDHEEVRRLIRAGPEEQATNLRETLSRIETRLVEAAQIIQ